MQPIILISGGGTGIGLETARQFLAAGARGVVLNGRREQTLRAAVAELDPSGDRVATVVGFIAEPAVARELTAATLRCFGRVDVLVNNAGIFRPTPFLEHTLEDVEAYLDVAIKGTFFASQAAIAALKQADRGRAIVNVGSLWANLAVEVFLRAYAPLAS